MLRVTAITTLFPSAARPGFGGFVERSLLRLAARPEVALSLIAPIGVPPFPLDRLPAYAALARLPRQEMWQGLRVLRPRFPLIPAAGWRINPALIARAVAPLIGPADVIHADFFFPCGVGAAAAARKLGLPYVMKARGSDIHYWGARGPARRGMLAAAAGARRLLAVSAAVARDMGAMGMPAERIAVHYTGVDLARFRPAQDRDALKRALGAEGPLVVSVGNLIALKGHDVVIRAVAALPGVRLRIIGEGPERSALEALIAELGLGGRVALSGRMPHEEVARWLAAADVMALASEREGLANAWVEALASGTPVVATAVGGAAEVIDRPTAGRLAARSPEAFAGAIRELLDAPPAPAAVRAAAERFDWETHARELYAHLAEAAGR